MNESNNLIRLSEGQSKTAGKMLARAFYDYPQVEYEFPNIEERSKKLIETFEFRYR
ncbi:hypothetical protein LCGC14_1870440 [marine sediment metagenome]|uniref:Uncharacterized protein n=1 Tax=marine sediment metagenome TaxID=412755 RepID=A0A0F9G540_9ZZZZ